jgi:uridine phosphorylase
MGIVQKTEKIKDALQYHTRLKKGDVGRYVLLPGDPARCDRVAKYLTDAYLVANNREHRTFTGTYHGIRVSVTSTGMGCPSTAIAAEELIAIGAKCLVRIGSTGALQPGMKRGDLVVSTGSMKNEGTSRFYVPQEFPAVPDFDLTTALLEACRDSGYPYRYGINASDDAFYGETPEWITSLQKLGVLNVEMESSALFTVSHVRGVRGAMISAVSGNLVEDDVEYEKRNVALEAGWDHEILVALDAIERFDRRLSCGAL